MKNIVIIILVGLTDSLSVSCRFITQSVSTKLARGLSTDKNYHKKFFDEKRKFQLSKNIKCCLTRNHGKIITKYSKPVHAYVLTNASVTI